MLDIGTPKPSGQRAKDIERTENKDHHRRGSSQRCLLWAYPNHGRESFQRTENKDHHRREICLRCLILANHRRESSQRCLILAHHRREICQRCLLLTRPSHQDRGQRTSSGQRTKTTTSEEAVKGACYGHAQAIRIEVKGHPQDREQRPPSA